MSTSLHAKRTACTGACGKKDEGTCCVSWGGGSFNFLSINLGLEQKVVKKPRRRFNLGFQALKMCSAEAVGGVQDSKRVDTL
jgi:hypothetical protein